ncbi:MAG: hypothetical protein ACOX9C_06575 [Kiritimatiellia bacterium]
MKIKNLWPLLLFVAAFAIGLVVFADALPATAVLQAPDATPGFGRTSLLRRLLPLLNGTQATVTHDDFLKVFHALVYHELSFILSTALAALAMGAYLHTLGLPAGACMAGGLAMAFSGYHFTLFNAGHRGYFIMMPYALFMFALVERALIRPQWFHFVLLAACAIAGLSTQPDVLLLLIMLLAAYGVFRLIQIGSDVGAKTYFNRVKKRLLFGVVLMAVAFAVLGHNTVRHLLDVQIAGREKQIEQVTGVKTDASAAEKSAEQLEKERNDLWIFATNWSLPPEAMAEFIAPCLRGLDTNNPKGPYWGRLGQAADFADHVGQPYDWLMQRGIYPNFRQHTLYLGAIPVSLAFFALLAACFGLLKPTAENAPPPGDVRRHWTGIVAFWAIAAFISLLLALGRHAPFYRLFYALPMMGKIRAPVKFVHLVEVATSVLFAFGLTRLSQPVAAENERRFRRLGQVFVIVAVVVAAICLFRAQFTNAQKLAPAMDRVLAPLFKAWSAPAASFHSLLADLHRSAFMRAAWLIGLAAASVGAVAFAKPAKRRAVALAFCALLTLATVLDMAEVGQRFVVVNNVAGKYAGNPIATAIKAQGKPDGLAFSYLQLTNQLLPGDVPFIDTLGIEGVMGLDPTTSDTPASPRVKTLLAFENDLVKRWKYWGAAAILTPPDVARDMTRAKLVKIVGLYDLDSANRLVKPRDPMRAQIAVSEPLGMIPPVAVFHGWRVVDSEDAALKCIAQKDFDLDREITVAGDALSDTPADAPCTPASWVVAPSETLGGKAVVKATTRRPGMLFVRENSLRAVPLTATVNGKRAPVYKANGIFTAIPVDAGDSTIVIRPALSAPHIIGHAAAATLVLLCLAAFIREGKAR